MEGRATKRYATLAALTLALGGAVFLNWSFAGRTPQAGTPEAVVQTSAEADEDTVQTAARQPETNAAVEPMTAQVESSIESLIKSKGFADCVVSIGEGRADITVMTENDALTADEVTRIRDAVLGKCKGLSAQDITVVEVR